MNPYNRHATREHWDAIADVIGETETAELYGPRPSMGENVNGDGPYYRSDIDNDLPEPEWPAHNSAESVERLYFNDKAPRRTLWAVVALAAVLACSVAWGATHRAERAETRLEPCALVLTRESGPECR